MPTLSEVMDIAVSGLAAQRVRMATTASNLANAETTRTPEGGPYRRRDPVFRAESIRPFADRLEREIRSVRVQEVVTDRRPPVRHFDPGHPDADNSGFVLRPNVSSVSELTNLMSASRSFEANLLIIRKAREMGDAAMQIGR